MKKPKDPKKPIRVLPPAKKKKVDPDDTQPLPKYEKARKMLKIDPTKIDNDKE